MRIVDAAYAFVVFIVAIVFAAAFGASATAAEPALTNPAAVMESLTPANVSEILTELGAQEVGSRDVDKKKVVDFRNGDTTFHILLVACEARPDGCLAMIMLVAFDPGQTSYSLESFNSFNREYPFVSAVKLEGNKYGVTRMLVVDGGVTKKNIAVNISSFADAPQVIAKHLASQVIAGVQQNGAQLQSASLGATKTRSIALSPREIAQIVDRLHLPNQTSLRGR